MADSKNILSKRSLRRHVKKNTDTAMARLHTCITDLESTTSVTELSPSSCTAHIPDCVDIDTESECDEGDWFMASDSEHMSATSGQEDLGLTNDSNSSDEQEGDSDTNLIDVNNLRDDIKVWAIATNPPISHISSLLSVLRKHLPNANLPKDGRTLLSTPTCTEVQSKAGGSMHYFGVANGVRARIDDNSILKSTHTLHLQINIDGLPLFKSSNQQFWPILGLIEEDPCRIPFVIGLYCGFSKPSDANEYLSDFVAEMGKLGSDGLEYQSYFHRIEISAFVCDAPARAFLKNIKAHNYYYGCERCVQEGAWLNQRLNYTETNSVLRTDEDLILIRK